MAGWVEDCLALELDQPKAAGFIGGAGGAEEDVIHHPIRPNPSTCGEIHTNPIADRWLPNDLEPRPSFVPDDKH